MSKGVNSDQILNEKTVPNPTNQRRAPDMIVIFLRPKEDDSSRREMVDSSNEMEDDRAANTSNKKNNDPIMLPAGICEKAMGRVIKSKPGPSAGDKPYWKTMGKIANPATTAVKPSANEIVTADLKMEEFLGIYAP